METPKHDSADRIRIAQVSGTVQRHATLKIHGDGYDETTATAELRGITTDPHLLAHGTVRTRHWMFRPVRALLIAAGADQADVDQLAADMETRMGGIGFPVGAQGEDQPQV